MASLLSIDTSSMDSFDKSMEEYMNAVGEGIYNEFNVDQFIADNSDMVQGIAKNGVGIVKEVADENDLEGLVNSADNTFNSFCAQFDAKAKMLDRMAQQVANNELELSALTKVTLGEVEGLTENIDKIQALSMAAMAENGSEAKLLPVAKSIITPALNQANIVKKQLIARQNDLLLATRAVKLEAATVLQMAEEIEELGYNTAALKVAKETCGVLQNFSSQAQQTLAKEIGNATDVKGLLGKLPGIMQKANVQFMGSILETGVLQASGISIDGILSSLGVSGIPSLGDLLGNIGSNLESAISNIPGSMQDELNKAISTVAAKVPTTGVAKLNKDQSKKFIKTTLNGVDTNNLGQVLDVLARTAYRR